MRFDLKVVHSEFEELANQSDIYLIAPSHWEEGRALAELTLNDFVSYCEIAECEMSNPNPRIRNKLFNDITYIRSTKVCKIQRKEWEGNFGKKNMRDWCDFWGGNVDTPVIVVSTRRINYSLKELKPYLEDDNDQEE